MSYDAWRTDCDGYWAGQDPADVRDADLLRASADARAETGRLRRLGWTRAEITALVVLNDDPDLRAATEWGMRQGLRDVAVEAEETLVRR